MRIAIMATLTYLMIINIITRVNHYGQHHVYVTFLLLLLLLLLLYHPEYGPPLQ
jgi:hypothetical protein